LGFKNIIEMKQYFTQETPHCSFMAFSPYFLCDFQFVIVNFGKMGTVLLLLKPTFLLKNNLN
jgi:hypothetical protein